MVDDRGRYRFWAELTAAQAHSSGLSVAQVKRRFDLGFRTICRLVDPTVTFELGAHEATFSSWAARTFPEARCLALEANPYVHAKHRERLLGSRVDYRLLAASSVTGPVTLHIPRLVRSSEKGPANRMGSLAVHRYDRRHESVGVDAVRVDELLQLRERDRIVVWIDVEGASEAVLTGARAVLERTSAVRIEVESEEVWPGQWLDTDVNRFFDSIGKVPVLRDLQRAHQYNVIYLDQELCAPAEVVECLAAVMRPPARTAAEPGSAQPTGVRRWLRHLRG